MNIRRTISLTAFLSFFVILLTSVVLYIVPQGRVAFWADWRLWSLSKEQWGNIHINVGLLFLLTLALHIYYNRRPISLYFKNKRKQFKLFTKDFNISLGLTLIVMIGTYIEVPPFSTIISIGDGFKEAAAIEYGEPPYGHAELSSIKTFSKKMGIKVEDGIEALLKAGYQVDSETQTLKEIANAYNVSPQQIYRAMVPTTNKVSIISATPQAMPESAEPGTGRLTLADLCSQYSLNSKVIMQSLKELQVTSEEGMTIKEIGAENNMSPIDVYSQIKSISENVAE